MSTLPRLDSRAAAVVVTLLLLGGTLPVADGMGPASLAVAGALSVSGGLALRRPVTAATLTGGVLTLALGLGPAHIGTGILASPLAIAALAAHGRPRSRSRSRCGTSPRPPQPRCCAACSSTPSSPRRSAG